MNHVAGITKVVLQNVQHGTLAKDEALVYLLRLKSLNDVEALKKAIQLTCKSSGVRYDSGGPIPYDRLSLSKLFAVLDPKEAAADYPLSAAQRGIFIVERLAVTGTSYNLPKMIVLQAQIDPERLERAFVQLIERHHILRTSFRMASDEPVQQVQRTVPFVLEHLGKAGQTASAQLRRFVRPFTLDEAPLFRAGYVQQEEQFTLFLDIHHLIADAASFQTIEHELMALYNGTTLDGPAGQYAEYALQEAQYLASAQAEAALAYWLSELQEPLPQLNLPLDEARPSVQSYRGAALSFRLEPELTGELRRLAQQRQVTLHMLLLATYALFLHEVSGDEDLIVGVPVTRRDRAELEGVIGMFINMLCLRMDFSGLERFTELLEQVWGKSMEAYRHAAYPFESLVAARNPARDLSRNAIFQTMFQFYEHIPPENPGSSQFELSMLCREGSEGSIEVRWEYNTDLFHPETIRQWSGYYQTLLSHVVREPELQLEQAELLSGQAKTELHERFTSAPLPALPPGGMAGWIEKQARRRPEAAAVIREATRVSYGELNEQADRLASRLRELGVRANTPVALLCGRSERLIIGLLGIVKAGGCYVPLDPAYPTARLSRILMHSGCRVVVTEEACSEHLAAICNEAAVDEEAVQAIAVQVDREVAAEKPAESCPTQHTIETGRPGWGGTVVNLDGAADGVTVTEAGAVPNHESPAPSAAESLSLSARAADSVLLSAGEPASEPGEELLYLIYTSGSTGTPKGVMVTRRNAENYVAWSRQAFGITEADIMVSLTSVSFDISVFEIFGALTSGASLYLPDDEALQDPSQLWSGLQEQGVTLWHSVPSRMAQLLLVAERYPEGLPQLREIMLGGEAWRASLASEVKERFPQARLTNLYGPTEATIWVTHQEISGEELVSGRALPIGRPIAGNAVEVQHANGQLCGIGIVGEICIRGINVTPGYYRDPERTQAAFSGVGASRLYRTGDRGRYRYDGTVDYLGREDGQVKVRGYRVETGEIEQALLRKGVVREAAVIVRAEEAEAGSAQLICYYTGAESVGAEELWNALTDEMPGYMLPARYIRLEAMPLTPNGKLDRKQLALLPVPEDSLSPRDEQELPADELEARFAAAWQKVLGVEQVSMTDRFFSLGGHSLLVIKLQLELEHAGVYLSAATIHEAGSCRDMVNKYRREQHHRNEGPEPLPPSCKLTVDPQEPATSQEAVEEAAGSYSLTEHDIMVYKVRPFNDALYKNCFYNSLFPVIQAFGKEMLYLLVHDLIVYSREAVTSDESILHPPVAQQGIRYVSAKPAVQLFEEMGMGMRSLQRAEALTDQIIQAIDTQGLVIIWVDSYYEPNRRDCYHKEHLRHTLLIYGYHRQERLFHVIEHRENATLSYEAITMSFDTIIEAYEGFASHFGEETVHHTYFEFYDVRTVSFPLSGLSDRLAQQMNHLVDERSSSLQVLAEACAEVGAITASEVRIAGEHENLLLQLNAIINVKKAELFRTERLWTAQSTDADLLRHIIANWNSIRAVIAKYSYSGRYQQNSMLDVTRMAADIVHWENQLYSSIRTIPSPSNAGVQL